MKLVIKCERASRYDQAEDCTYGSPRTVTRVLDTGHNKAYNTIQYEIYTKLIK